MPGRIHGFLGGVLFTASLVYYTGEYIKKDQQFISRQLQISNTVINDNIISGKSLEPINRPPPKMIQYNGGFYESAKDIWNEEIFKMVNWLYSINWYELGVKTDEKVMKLTDKLADQVKK